MGTGMGMGLGFWMWWCLRSCVFVVGKRGIEGERVVVEQWWRGGCGRGIRMRDIVGVGGGGAVPSFDNWRIE